MDTRAFDDPYVNTRSGCICGMRHNKRSTDFYCSHIGDKFHQILPSECRLLSTSTIATKSRIAASQCQISVGANNRRLGKTCLLQQIGNNAGSCSPHFSEVCLFQRQTQFGVQK